MGESLTLQGTLPKGTELKQAYKQIHFKFSSATAAQITSDLNILFTSTEIVYANQVIVNGAFAGKTTNKKILIMELVLQDFTDGLDNVLNLVTGFSKLTLLGTFDAAQWAKVAELTGLSTVATEYLVINDAAANGLAKLFQSTETGIRFEVSRLGFTSINEYGRLEYLVQESPHQLVVLGANTESKELLSYHLEHNNVATVKYTEEPLATQFLVNLFKAARLTAVVLENVNGAVSNDFKNSVSNLSLAAQHVVKGYQNRLVTVNGKLCMYRSKAKILALL